MAADDPSRKGRCDSARRDFTPDDLSANHPCSIARTIGRTTDPDHTAPYGADPIVDRSLVVNCQATIILSLRTKMLARSQPRPAYSAPRRHATRDTRHADTPKHRYAENVPVPATVDPRSGMKVCCAKTCFSATRKVLNKNFSSRNSRKTGLAQAQKIAWHNGCLRGFTSSD